MEMHYPANFLRNLAMDKVKTRFMFGIDVDFLPSNGLYSRLVSICSGNSELWGSNTVVAIPAFDIARGVTVTDKNGLLAAIQAEKAKPVLKQGQKPKSEVEWDPSHVWFIDYDKWYSTTIPYYQSINSFENEPYLVVDLANGCVPYYDERFYYRGADKQEWTHHLHVLNFKFLVLDTEFIYHKWHPPSEWNNDHTSQTHTLRTNQLGLWTSSYIVLFSFSHVVSLSPSLSLSFFLFW